MGWYDFLRYQAVPPLFLVVFTSAVQVLALWGQNRPLVLINLGSGFTYWLVALYTLWALSWLWYPAKTTKGPPDPQGYVPVYKNNGVAYYWSSLLCLACIEILWSGFCTKVYQSTPELLGSLNILALVLCSYLYAISPPSQLPRAYIFYRGGQLHPKLLGVDVKQLTNSRLGVMAWQLLVTIYWYHGLCTHGFNMGAFTNFFLQSVYLCGFFMWEGGYFHTLDITLDRAGYYLCWGCLVWVPCLYTHSSYVLASRPALLTTAASSALLLLGSLAVLLKSLVDLEKLVFRSKGTTLGGSPALFIAAPYRDDRGDLRSSKLLVSGSWAVARHLNYTFELLSALCWSLPGLGRGLQPFLYFIFLLVLLVHRLFRDEEKCSRRYGQHWKDYCKRVPYRLVPYLF